VRVLLGRHVAGLLEERHVDERCRVALRAGVAVPIPRPAEVARLVDDADVVDARFLQPGSGDEPSEAAADEHHGHVIGDPWAFGPRREWIVEVVGELSGDADVLVVAVRPEALGALATVLLLERVLVDAAMFVGGVTVR